MASTYSDLKFELIGTGEQSGTWGTTTNTNIGTAIQEAITGSGDVTFASGAVALTLTNSNAAQTARNLRLNLTGTSGGAQNLTVPDIEKFYLVNNGCADAITVKNSTGATVAVPAGKAMLLFSTGSAIVDAVSHMSSVTLATALAVSSGGTGSTTAGGARTNLGLGALAVLAQVDTGQIVDDAVTTAKILDANVTAGKIATDAVTTVKILDANVTAAKLATDAVTTVKILDANVTAGKIATDAVTTVKILDDNVTTAKILDANVTDAKIATMSSSKLTGALPAIDGSALTGLGGGGFSNMEAFTSSGTWTNPGSVTKVKVTVVGGGGSGGGGGGGTVGFGGGGGGTAIEVVTIPTSPVSVTRGAGAGLTPNANVGSTGGTSSFGAYCSATGGGGGGRVSPSEPTVYSGVGGVGSGGTLNIRGSGGGGSSLQQKSPNTVLIGGEGGSSHMGGGARMDEGIAGPGRAGGSYGGGGGGGDEGNGTSGNGGPGAAGVVIVEY